MAITNKTYLDYTGLSAYDTKIKQHITTESAKAYKTVLLSNDNKILYFYKKENATLSDIPDFTVNLIPGELNPSFSGTSLIFS